MHPAKSVILFTTLSGAGYGILVWLSAFSLVGKLGDEPWLGQISAGLAIGLILAGLLISTLHLGHPERAWRALSQWRSSWLSREGLLAVVTFVPAAIFAGQWVAPNIFVPAAPVAATLTILLSMATVFATGMIYATLKAIPAWSNQWTVPVYLIFSLMSGVLILNFLADIFASEILSFTTPLAAFLLFLGMVVKFVYWTSIGSKAPVSTAESATGLGELGRVMLLESPHSGPNYLMREMGYQIARRHAEKLRIITILFGFLVPLLLLGGGSFVGSADISLMITGLVLAFGSVGVLIERWLFFAEAKHVVTLYYGTKAV